MSKAEQFWQYAEEALCRARQAKTEKEKQAYTDLALTWTQAASVRPASVGGLPSFQHVVLPENHIRT